MINFCRLASIGYIGHSQGTGISESIDFFCPNNCIDFLLAIMFALLSSKPDWAKVIDPFIALAPVAFVGNIVSPIRYFAEFSNALRYVLCLMITITFTLISYLIIGRISHKICIPREVSDYEINWIKYEKRRDFIFFYQIFLWNN